MDDAMEIKQVIKMTPYVGISYQNQPGNMLMYAERLGLSPWGIATVDTEGGSFTSLALDSQKRPCIAYHIGAELSTIPGGGLDSELRYATRAPTWSNSMVDWEPDHIPMCNVGVELGLVLDANDKPHIAYRTYDQNHGTYNAVMIARRPALMWEREFIEGEVDGSNGDYNIGARAVVAMDGDAEVVVYSDDTPGKALKCAMGQGVGRNIEEIDSGSGFLHWPAVLAVNGEIHVAYHDGSPFGGTANDLKYASRAQGTWMVETIEGPDNVGMHAAIAHHDGVIAIVYINKTDRTICAVRKIGGTWADSIPIDDIGNPDGAHLSCAFDLLGALHVAYYCDPLPGLKHAVSANGVSWATDVVQSGQDVGHYPSIRAI
jgi:hypothetical protein